MPMGASNKRVASLNSRSSVGFSTASERDGARATNPGALRGVAADTMASAYQLQVAGGTGLKTGLYPAQLCPFQAMVSKPTDELSLQRLPCVWQPHRFSDTSRREQRRGCSRQPIASEAMRYATARAARGRCGSSTARLEEGWNSSVDTAGHLNFNCPRVWLKWLEASNGLTAVDYHQGLQIDTCAGWLRACRWVQAARVIGRLEWSRVGDREAGLGFSVGDPCWDRGSTRV